MSQAYDYHLVYFMWDGEFLKIGRTESLKKLRSRQTSLQIGNPRKIHLIGTIKSTIHSERQLHNRFKHLRSHGEWFVVNPEVQAFLEELGLRLFPGPVDEREQLRIERIRSGSSSVSKTGQQIWWNFNANRRATEAEIASRVAEWQGL